MLLRGLGHATCNDARGSHGDLGHRHRRAVRACTHARFLRRNRRGTRKNRVTCTAERVQLWRHFGCVTLIPQGFWRYRAAHGDRSRPGLARAGRAAAARSGARRWHLPVLACQRADSRRRAGEVQQSLAGRIGRTGDIDRPLSISKVTRSDRPTDPRKPDERRHFIGFHLKRSTTARLFALLDTSKGNAAIVSPPTTTRSSLSMGPRKHAAW